MNGTYPVRSLAEVLEIKSGQVDPTTEPYSNLVHVGGDNIEPGTGRLANTSTARELGLKSGKYLFDEADVLYSKIRPNLNKVVAPGFGGICSADIYPLRPKDDLLDQSFLVHLLRTKEFLAYTQKHSSRTNIPKVNRTTLLAFEVPLPPLSEQKRIADILDKADAIRRKRREATEQIDQLPLAAFRNRFSTLAPDAELSEVAEVVSGVAKGRRLNGDTIREVPYLRVANVQAGYLDLTEIKRIPAKESEIAQLALQHGDVVMTEGGDHDKLGRGALWDHDVADCIHQNHVFRVRTDRSRLLPTFFVHYLQTEGARHYFLRCAKKTTNLASINMTQLRGLPVPIPSMSEQREFEAEVAAVRKLGDRHTSSAAEADDLFHSLVQRAFRGDL